MIRSVNRLNRKRNETIMEMLDITSVLTIVVKNKFRWFEYVQRMRIQKYPRFQLDWMPEGEGLWGAQDKEASNWWKQHTRREEDT